MAAGGTLGEMALSAEQLGAVDHEDRDGVQEEGGRATQYGRRRWRAAGCCALLCRVCSAVRVRVQTLANMESCVKMRLQQEYMTVWQLFGSVACLLSAIG